MEKDIRLVKKILEAVQKHEGPEETDFSQAALGLQDIDSRVYAFHTKIRGVTKTNLNGSKRQKLIKNLRVGKPVFCVREPNNPFDKNAIAVYDTEKNQLGYLSADLAKSYAKEVDKGLKLTAIVKDLTGGFLRKRGVNLYVIVVPPIKKPKSKPKNS